MRYELDGDVFSATFDYDDYVNESIDAAIAARFPDKPVVYRTAEETHLQEARHRAEFG